MPLTVEQIRAEIRPHIPSFDDGTDDQQATCVLIAEFLEDGAARRDQLQQLEDSMIALIANRINVMPAAFTPARRAIIARTFADRTGTRAADAQKLPLPYRNVLSTVLHQAEITNGLRDSVLFTNFIEPDFFRHQLRRKRPFKDPTVPGGHGEFTHRIQWNLVFQGVAQPLGGWGNFYRWVGLRASVLDPKVGLWDILFDRNPSDRPGANGPFNTAEETDFRSPENLHKYLRAYGATCPILQGFIDGRHRKRENQGLMPTYKNSNQVALRDYLSRKIYGVPYTELPLADRADIPGRVRKNVMVPAPRFRVSRETEEQAQMRELLNLVSV